MLDAAVPCQLFSFFYLRQYLRRKTASTKAMLARMREAKKLGYVFFLDSGAFTFSQNPDAVGVSAEAYFREYQDFIRMHGDLFDIIAELDIDSYRIEGELISLRQVDDWTNELLEGPHGSKIMPVFHERRTKAWLVDWLSDTRSPFVALGSAIPRSVPQLIGLAHEFGKYVHGFGYTRVNTDMKYQAFDSVDSSTWISRTDKFGGTTIFMNGRFIVFDSSRKRMRALYRTWYERMGLDFSKIIADDLRENRLASVIAWREFAVWKMQQNANRPLPYLYAAHIRGEPPPAVHPRLISKA